MPDEGQRPVGITFRETMAGGFSLDETDPRVGEERGKQAGTVLTMRAAIAISDLRRFVADPLHAGGINGSISFAPLGGDIPAKGGQFNLFSPADHPGLKLMVYELAFELAGQAYYLAGKKEVHDGPGFDLWKDTTTLYTQLHQGSDTSGPVVGAGVVSLSPLDLVALVSTMRATNAGSLEEAAAVVEFGRFFLGELWDSYAKHVAVGLPWWRRWWRRLFGAG